MNPWVMIIAQYGIPFAFDLKKLIEEKNEPTAADFAALVGKYGTETLEQKLAKLYAATVPAV